MLSLSATDIAGGALASCPNQLCPNFYLGVA